MYEGLKNLEAPRRARKRSRRVFKIGLAGLLVFTLGFGAYAFDTWRVVTGALNRAKDPSINVIPAPPKGPINILVLGSDRRDVIEDKDKNKRQFRGPKENGQRADTIILMHLSADGQHAILVHFPRDLRVPIAGTGRLDKLNSSYAGGPNQVIKTIQNFSGLSINHYVEVNFSSFREIVDAVGGVSISITRPLVDRRSGLNLPHPGCYDMNGDTALSFVRARYVYANADFGRIQAQQLFMRSLMHKVKSIGFLLDFGRVKALARAVGRGVRYDTGVDLGLARSIANRLSGFDQKKVDFRMVPSYPEYIGGVSYVLARPSETRPFFAAIKADRPLPDYGKTSQSIPVPGDVSVQVLNGSGKVGLGGKEAAKLRALGFHIVGISTAPARPNSIATYEPGSELKARLFRSKDGGLRVKSTTRNQPADIVVTLGRDRVPHVGPSGSPVPASASPTRDSPLLDVRCG